MAETDTGAERTEEATPKRLADARKKGDVARSRELNTVLMLLASIIGLVIFGASGAKAYRQLAHNQWQIEREYVFTDQGLLNGFLVPFIEALWIAAPFLFLMFLAAFLGPLLMGGWVFSTSSIKIDFKKLSPLAGLKRLFGIQSLVELFKSMLKVLVLAVLSVVMFRSYIDDYLMLGALPMTEAVESMFKIIFSIIFVIVLSLSLVAAVDVPYQKWSHAKKLRMTFQETREENKEQNGNPEIKSKIRQMQQANANRRMLQDVQTADVVIVNPSHFSVALRYDDEYVAPVVVAAGVDHMAFKIREIADHHKVEIFSAPPLARALYYHSNVGETIPSELYLAVAQVLAYVVQVKEAKFSDKRSIEIPRDLPVPPSLDKPKSK